MNNWKNIIFSNWDWMRWLRLGLAVYILIEAFQTYDVMFGVLALVLLLQAIFNVGCCGSTCATGKTGSEKDQDNEVVFEEITAKK